MGATRRARLLVVMSALGLLVGCAGTEPASAPPVTESNAGPVDAADPSLALTGTYDEGHEIGLEDGRLDLQGNVRSTKGKSPEWIDGYDAGRAEGNAERAAAAAAAEFPRIGERFTLDGVAEIVVNAAERRDQVESELPDYTPHLQPRNGGTLWLLSMNWTNLTNEAVSKVCWGPNSAGLQVFDTKDREMLMRDDSGSIVGNDCTNGLMTGQSGDWYQAFDGLPDSVIGYAVFTEPVPVTI